MKNILSLPKNLVTADVLTFNRECAEKIFDVHKCEATILFSDICKLNQKYLQIEEFLHKTGCIVFHSKVEDISKVY